MSFIQEKMRVINWLLLLLVKIKKSKIKDR